MFRGGSEDEDSSASEGEIPPPKAMRHNTPEPTEQKKERKDPGRMWAELLAERELTEGLSGGAFVKEMAVSRGVESYDVPDQPQPVSPTPVRENRSLVPRDGEDLFAEVPDLDAVEGPIGQPGIRSSVRGKERPRFGRNRWWNGKAAVTNRDKSCHDNRFEHSSSGKDRGRWQHQNNRKRTYNDTHVLVSDDYSLETLMSIEFPENLPIRELGERMAKALGERFGDTIVSVVEMVGEDVALKLFNQARETEAAGGLMVANGSRRRTPGGVFLALFRDSPDVPQDIKDIFAERQRQEFRKMKKITKRPQRDASLKEKKDDIKDLPSAANVILGLTSGQDADNTQKLKEDMEVA